MLRFALPVLGLALLAPQLVSQTVASQTAASQLKEQPVSHASAVAHHAHGTFTVKMQPLTPAPAEGTARFSIDKQISGDLDGTSKGEMISAGDPQKGVAGYIAMEVFTGTLAGKHGSFALQHSCTMDAAGQHMNILVTPGSGTGELAGITGKFTIIIADGKHSYDMEYTLPQ
jgi:hypothetical protein